MERKLYEIIEEFRKVYMENYPNGGRVTATINETGAISIYNYASYDDKYEGSLDLFTMQDGEVISFTHNEKGDINTLRTKEGEWLV